MGEFCKTFFNVESLYLPEDVREQCIKKNMEHGFYCMSQSNFMNIAVFIDSQS